MAQPYIGEIRLFAGNFAPSGWAFCHGQLMPISENDQLFVVIGTTYGGDGEETFALPDLRGRVPIHQGLGPGLSSTRILGETGGTESTTLTVNQIPSHTHAMLASSDTGTLPDPGNHVVARSHTANVDMYLEDLPNVNMSSNSISPVGGSQPHENMQPFLAVSFILALFGLYPPPP
jgi:microcystin-dependent protein